MFKIDFLVLFWFILSFFLIVKEFKFIGVFGDLGGDFLVFFFNVVILLGLLRIFIICFGRIYLLYLEIKEVFILIICFY